MRSLALFLLLQGAIVFGFIHIRPNFVSHYRVSGADSGSKRSFDTVKCDLYFSIDEGDGSLKGILKNLEFGSETKEPTKFKDELQNKPFFVKVNEEGIVNANFFGEKDSEWDNRLQAHFRPYWNMINFDHPLKKAILTEEEHAVGSSLVQLDWNDRICNKSYTVAFDNPQVYTTVTTVDSEDCQKDHQLENIGSPHAFGYLIQLKREYFRDDLTLKRQEIYFNQVDYEDAPPTEEVNMTVTFERFLPWNKFIFESKATPITTPCMPMTHLFPFKAGFDSKFSFAGSIKDFDTEIEVSFVLNLRLLDEFFMFGRITDLNFSKPDHEDASRFREILNPPFVFGFGNSSGTTPGRILHKFLNQDRDEKPLSYRKIYDDTFAIDPHVLKLIHTKPEFEETQTMLYFDGGEEPCTKQYRVTGEQNDFTVHFDVDGNRCLVDTGLYGSSMMTTKMVSENKIRFVDGKIHGFEWTSEWRSVEYNSLYVKVDLKAHFAGYAPKEENDEGVFKLFDSPIDEEFFTRI